jgi:uncharacterized membrane protein YeaQ/YmgE (transglycosylase-associated protein family)
MSNLARLVVGLIAGFLASRAVNKAGSGLVMDIALGVPGPWSGASSSMPWVTDRAAIHVGVGVASTYAACLRASTGAAVRLTATNTRHAAWIRHIESPPEGASLHPGVRQLMQLDAA